MYDRPCLCECMVDWLIHVLSSYPTSFIPSFRIISVRNASIFYDFISANVVIDIFTNASHANKVELVKLVHLLLTLLHELEPESHEDVRRSVVNVTKVHLFSKCWTAKTIAFCLLFKDPTKST